MEEYFDIVDEGGQVIGQSTRAECHTDPNLIHRAVHILVVDSQDRIFLQKRSPEKDIQPGKWDTSVGGHLIAGESYEQAALRELEEELGVTGVTTLFILYSYPWRTSLESEDVRTYIVVWKGPGLDGPGLDGRGRGSGVPGEDTSGRQSPVEDTPGLDGPFTLQPEEITEGRFWSFREIQEHIGKDILTPNFEQEFDRYLQWRAQQRRTG